MDNKKIFLFLLLILVIASFFRLWHLNSIPPGLYPDEAMNGNNALEAIETGEYKLYYPENNGREGLFINLQALSLKIFGVNIWSLKLVSALIGILTVLGLYFLTKELFNSTAIALLSMFFIATSFWHVNFSRIGFRAIVVPFCLVWSFYFLFKGFRKKRVPYFIISGIFFGLGFHTYISYRFTVLLLPLILLFWWSIYKKQNLQKQFLFFIFYFLFFIFITALPIGLYFLHNPQDFIGRAGGVSVFAKENPIKESVLATIKTLGMFNVVGDKNWRHNFAGSPQLFWPVGVLFIIGLILSVKRLIKSLKEKNYSLFNVYSFLLIWFIAMLLPAILTAEGLPHALRTIGVIPVCYIFAALGGYNLYKSLESGKINKNLLIVVCLVFLFICGANQFSKYFINWAKKPEVEASFAKNFVEIGKYLNSLADKTNRYVIVNQFGVMVPLKQNSEIKNIPAPAQTTIFVEAMLTKSQDRKKTNYILPEEINAIKPSNKTIIIPLQHDYEIFKKLKDKFSRGEIIFHQYFWSFELEK